MVYKLRTMALDADSGVDLAVINERTDGPLFKAAHDPRVTRVGAVVRALSIDELPQLFNVLTGTMSLVGPRPALPQEVAQFDPELLRRHDVKPGITGLWQLEARDNPSFHAYRRLDLLYVDNWSIGLDLFILLATVPMVIARAMSVCRRERKAARGAIRGSIGAPTSSFGPRGAAKRGACRQSSCRRPCPSGTAAAPLIHVSSCPDAVSAPVHAPIVTARKLSLRRRRRARRCCGPWRDRGAPSAQSVPEK